MKSFGIEIQLLSYLENNYGVNVYAALLQLVCVVVLLMGVKVGKAVVNVFTILKSALVVFMIIAGLLYFNSENLKEMVPLGASGVMRGSSVAFFGLLGYDEVCIMSAEAKDPHVTIPWAVSGTIVISTIFSVLASLALVGMQPYLDIDPENGFSNAFKSINLPVAQHIVAAGEVLTLPLVVLVSFLAQPRLQYEMSIDRLLPSVFSEIDANGNLSKGIFISGAILTVIALFVPFSYLGDMISAGVLLSFNLTNTSLVAIRRVDGMDSKLCHRYLFVYNGLCLVISCVVATVSFTLMSTLVVLAMLVLCVWIVYSIDIRCPEREDTQASRQYRVPFVPYMPCLAILLNSILLGQLSATGIYSMLGYTVVVIAFYALFSLYTNRGEVAFMRSIKPISGNGSYEVIRNTLGEDFE
jgi:APA family basic amino acid/polyamine antiporter